MPGHRLCGVVTDDAPQKISVALGAYAGFKLLFPVGPLIVATRLGVADSALRRTASLLLIIGAASAFAGFLTLVAPIEKLFTAQQGGAALVVLFLMSAGFKILQGSSMSVFAAVGPIALPVFAASQLSPPLAVIALCLGSFVAILPNDSFYWLIRKSALAAESEWNAIKILLAGSTLQAVVGFAVLILFYVFYS